MRDDLTRIGYGLYVLELVERFMPDEEPLPALYDLLTRTLHRMLQAADPRIAVRYYEVHLLDLLGFRPQLFHCVSCGEPIQPQDQYFGFLAGGVLCPACGEERPHTRPVRVDTLRYLRHFQRSAWPEARKAQPAEATHQELEALLQAYFAYLLERALYTPAFLRRIRKPGTV